MSENELAMTEREELKQIIWNLSAEQLIKALPKLISELEAQGVPAHRLLRLQSELTLS